MQFASPYFLWLLAVIPLMVVYYVWRTRQGGASIQVSTIDGVAEAPRTVRYYLRHLPFALRCAAVALLIVALARPQSVDEGSTSNTEGIDIVLAIDISTSMLAQDLQPDRIQAAKQVAGNFITDRPGDRIGLVAFAGEAFTQSPLTTDQGTLQTLLGRLRSGVVEDGTAIGNGLATAINRLRESNAKSKVIILLTDGENNRGEIAPLTAAEIARDQGIRVYTIGVGTRGTAPYPTVDFFGNPTVVQAKVQIDEKILGEIADLTGGRYFRATDNAKLQSIYDEINQLEKSKVEISQYTTYTEEYLRWAKAFARRISPSMVSVQGTDIGQALSLATMSFSEKGDNPAGRVIVLITDGEGHDSGAIEAAERAAEQGIRIFTIGIGTPEGAPIQIGGEFIKDDKGEMVVSKLGEPLLEKIAQATDGAYIRSTNQSIGLDEIVRTINNMEKGDLAALRFEEFNEQFQYLIGAALVLLLLEFLLLDRRNPLLRRFNIFGTDTEK